MYKFFTLLLFSFISCNIFAQTDYKKITLDEVKANMGNQVMICDSISDTFVAKGDKKTTYLHFGATYPNVKLTAVIFEKDVVKFESSPAIFLMDKKVCITGLLKEYKGKPEIIVSDPSQIIKL